MANNQQMNIRFRRNTNQDEPVNFRALALKYLGYWPLFTACVIVAMLGAYIYSKYSKPAYNITATLMIQDASDQQPPPEPKSSLVDFQALEQVNAPKVVENEIQVLKSNLLIKNVVDHFQLWADYKLKGGLVKNQDLYGISPVKLNLYNYQKPLKPQKLDLRIIDSRRYQVLSATDKNATHKFGDIVNDGLGSWSISGNPNIKRFIGNEILININDPEATALNYQNNVNVEAGEKPASLISISMNDKNVARAEDFVNYLIYAYRQGDLAEKSKITKSTLSFIDNRLDSLSGQLSKTENNIEGYRSQNGLTDINAQSQMYLQGIQANGQKLNDIDVQLNVIDKLEAYLDDPSDSANIPSTLGISDQYLSELVQKLSDVELERTKMLATTPEKNPAFEPIDNQIASLKQEIKQNIKSIKSSLLTMKQSLDSFASNIQSSIKSVPVQEHQLAGLGRQQSNKSELYNYLLQQRETISLTYAASASEIRVIDMAHALPLKASKRMIPFAVALLLGLVVPAGFIYGRDTIRHTITNRRELERLTDVPVIGEFSLVELPSDIVFDNKPDKDSFILIEQFRNLRTQLNSLNQEGAGGFCTIVTSSVANEGKSFISSNLAVSLANSGRKTVLLEMDIYQPKIRTAFKLPGGPGITDVLNGTASLKDVIRHSERYPNLYIIPSGDFIDNFSELLDQQVFQDLLTELKAKFEHIVFDAAPVHSINDGYLIAKNCNVSLYLVRYDFTSQSLMPFVKKLHEEERLPGMNIVFNGLVAGRDSEGYRYENYYRGTA